jgi:hypothetical protein
VPPAKPSPNTRTLQASQKTQGVPKRTSGGKVKIPAESRPKGGGVKT